VTVELWLTLVGAALMATITWVASTPWEEESPDEQ
jgi:hypothetical protein